MVYGVSAAFPKYCYYSPSQFRYRHSSSICFLQTCCLTPLSVLSLSTSLAFQRSTSYSPNLRSSCIIHVVTSNSHNVNEIGLLYSLLREVGVSEKETEWILRQNPDSKFASFESIRSRLLLLQKVGIKSVELYRLLIKCPLVLTAQEVDILLHFLLLLEEDFPSHVKPEQLKRLLTAINEPRLLTGFDCKVNILLQHGVPKEKIVHLLNNVNLAKAVCLKSFEEIDRTITFLKRVGGIDVIVKRPQILNYDLDTQLIPRFEFLKKLSGGDEEAAGAVLRKLPAILSYSVKHMASQVEVLRSFAGLSDPQIFKIFLVFPSMVSASKERKLYPRIQFLKQCGLNPDEIFKFLTKAPLFLGLSFRDNLAQKLVFLVKVGYEYGTKELAFAVGAVTRTSCENLQNVIGIFLAYGLSFQDVLAMSKKHPQILQYRHDSLEEKMGYLIHEMGRDIGELLSFPAFLGYKFDERIKHRYEVKRRTIGEGMSINKLLSVSADRFSAGKKKKSYATDELGGDEAYIR